MEPDPPPLPAGFGGRPPVHPARGWLLVVLGVFLSGAMAWLIVWLQQALLHNGDPGARSHWTGGAAVTRGVFGLFWSVFAFGLVSIGSGIYILRTRRLSRVIFGVMLAAVAVMVYFGYTIMTTHVPR